MKNRKYLCLIMTAMVLLSGCSILSDKNDRPDSDKEQTGQNDAKTVSNSNEGTSGGSLGENSSGLEGSDSAVLDPSQSTDASAASLSSFPDFVIYSNYDSVMSEDDRYNTLIDIRYPMFDINDEYGPDYKDQPVLRNIMLEFNDRSEARAMAFRQNWADMASEDYQERFVPPAEDFGYGGWTTCYEYKARGYVMRADVNVISVIENAYSYANGAHGDYFFTTENIDMKTGELIKLSDLGIDQDKLPEMIGEALLSKYDENIFYEGGDVASSVKEVMESPDGNGLSFTLGFDGVDFWFSDFQLAPYAAGCQMVSIPYEDLGIVGDYAFTGDCYVIPTITNMAYTLSDGSLYTPVIDMHDYSEDSPQNTILLQLDDTMATCPNADWYYSADGWLFHKNGQNYCYLNLSGEGGYDRLAIYDLNGGRIGQLSSFDEDLSFAYSTTPLTPDHFKLGKIVQALSTMYVTDYFYLDENGLPTHDSKWYDVSDMSNSEASEYPVILTLKQDFDADMLESADSVKTQTTTLSKGTKLFFYRTDGTSIVDMKTADGRIIRFRFEPNQYPHLFNGIDENDLFDGAMYAG